MYLAILGRQTEISLTELEALFTNVHKIGDNLAEFDSETLPKLDRLGGSLKLAVKLDVKPLDYLRNLPEGKITFGVSDYSRHASRRTATMEALKLKKILMRHNRKVRVVESKDAALSTATSLHNGLSGKNERKAELIKVENNWYKVIGVQDIDAYTRRDQARPARDAKVGMLPPKLAQILINLCGELPKGATILDPFCGTGVVLQEALLMGYRAYGTDISERMVKYSEKNLRYFNFEDYKLEVGDAANLKWQQPVDAVACEGYLGKPMSTVPPEIKLKTEKQECETIILGFLKNLAKQIKPGTPVVIACPAWLREDGTYERLDIFDRLRGSSKEKQSFSSEAATGGQLFSKKEVDNIVKMGYNVNNKSHDGLFYHREGQIVARDIIILRKS